MSDVLKKLDDAIPEQAISSREAWKNGPVLSYLSGAYVIARLNKVLGQGNWSYRIDSLTKVFEGTVKQGYKDEDVFATSYIAQIELTAKLGSKEELESFRRPPGEVYFAEVGYGDGTDKKNPGKAHELAVKEAVTDGLKRAAKNLGMSFGLELYFKEGAYRGEETSTESKTEEKLVSEAPKKSTEASSKVPESKILRKQIKEAFGVLQAQKKISKEDFVTNYLEGKKTEDLTDSQFSATLTKIKEAFPELGLN